MKFFFDHNISPVIPHALQSLFKDEHKFVALRDKFEPDISDIEWIGALGKDDQWVVISADRRITKNKAEQAAFRNSKLIGLFMAAGLQKSPVVKQMERLLALWPTIILIPRTVQGGAMYELPMTTTRLKQIR